MAYNSDGEDGLQLDEEGQHFIGSDAIRRDRYF